MSALKTLKLFFSPERSLLLGSIGLILFFNREFLLSPWPAGWDTLPQIHLFYKMVRLLHQGTVFGYDLENFGGYPLFIFYGFLPYLLAGLIHIASFGLIPILLLAKLTIVGTPILFIVTIYIFIGVFLGKEYRFAGMIAFQAFLFFSITPHLGIGIGGAVHQGLFISLIGTCLVLWTLICLEKFYQTQDQKFYFYAILFMVAVVFTHVISSVIAAAVVSIYFIHRKMIRQLFLFWIVVFSITIFYIYPYIAQSQLSNSGKLSSFSEVNPLQSLVGIDWSILSTEKYNFIDFIKNITTLNTAKFILFSKSVINVIREIQPLNLMLFSSFFIGFKLLVDGKNRYLPTIFFLYMFFIVSDYCFISLDLPLHYYRFHAFFYVVYLLIATCGMCHLLHYLAAKSQFIGKRLTFALLLIVVVYIGFFNNSGEVIDWGWNYLPEQKIIQYVRTLKPAGRVFIERSRDEPNPHLFNVYLPILYHIPTIFGLLAESSDNARYIIPPIKSISNNLVWGGANYSLTNLPYEYLIRKIGDLGIQLFCLRSPDSIALMENYLKRHRDPMIEIKNQIGPYFVYGIKNYLPFISSLKHKPILCLNEYPGLSNDDIIQWFFDDRSDPDIKLAFWNKNEWPPVNSFDSFETLLVVIPEIDQGTLQKIAGFKGQNACFLVKSSTTSLAAFPKVYLGNKNRVRYFSFDQFEDILAYLKKTIKVDPHTREIHPTSVSDTKIEFNSYGPVVVNMGYFPYWHADDELVYRLSPSKILVFSHGRTTLNFSLPIFQKFLFIFSCLCLFLLVFKRKVLFSTLKVAPKKTTNH